MHIDTDIMSYFGYKQYDAISYVCMKTYRVKAKSNFWKAFGPGIMFAGTCIGGSHLVQSTHAGAQYGFDLLYLILLANIFKYPFFEFASRYTNATGESILEGYKKLGRWTLYLYGGITLISMFIVTGAILFVTGGLFSNMLPVSPEVQTSEFQVYCIIGLGTLVFAILLIGKFSVLDQLLKIIGVVLVISVLVATVMVFIKGRPASVDGFTEPDAYTTVGFGVMIVLMGWMPMGVDMSAWHSIWTQERIKQTKYHPTLKETLADFNIGYLITVVLAICFLTLGAYVFYGSGTALSPNGAVFSNQLVSAFTMNIGDWSYVIIAAAAFSTMFGTSLTLIDGYARSMDRVIMLLRDQDTTKFNRKTYNIWLLLTLLGGLTIVVLGILVKDTAGNAVLNFKQLIDMATALSFIIAPVAAFLNYKIIFSLDIAKSFAPPKRLKVLAIAGLIFLSLFTIGYLCSLIIA